MNNMKAFSFKSARRVITILLAALLVQNIASAQDLAGRRYITEDQGKCHDYLMKAITSNPEFEKTPALERQTVVGFLSVTEMNIAIAFKSKNRFTFTVMFNLNEKVAKAMGLEGEKMEKAKAELAQMSSEMKESGTYSIENNVLILKSKTGEKSKLKILDKDMKKLQAPDLDNLIFKKVK